MEIIAEQKKEDVREPVAKPSKILAAITSQVNREGVTLGYDDWCDHHEHADCRDK